MILGALLVVMKCVIVETEVKDKNVYPKQGFSTIAFLGLEAPNWQERFITEEGLEIGFR